MRLDLPGDFPSSPAVATSEKLQHPIGTINEKRRKKAIKVRSFRNMTTPQFTFGFYTHLSLSLPQSKSSSPSVSSIPQIFSQFLHQLSVYESVWRRLKELDHGSWVVEGNERELQRRIVLNREVQAEISYDSPEGAEECPTFKFLGPGSKVEEMRERLCQRQHLFDPELDLATNVERILDLELPKRDDSQRDDFRLDCSICYSDVPVPAKTCDGDGGCGQRFHEGCLLTWLKTFPENEFTFNRIGGKCPICDAKIFCEERC